MKTKRKASKLNKGEMNLKSKKEKKKIDTKEEVKEA
jgi:hypothetical protein